jgi:hypothetical protein
VGPGDAPDALDLLHHVHVDDLPARRVDDDEVVPAVPGLLDAPLGDLLRLRPRPLGVDRHGELAPDLLQLLDGRRTIRVARDEVGVLAELAHEERELAGRRGLAVAVEAREHHDRRRAGGEGELVRGAAHEVRQLLVDDLDDLLARAKRLRDVRARRPLAHVGDELLYDAVVDVRLEQGQPDLARYLLYLVLGEVAAAADAVEGLVEPVA